MFISTIKGERQKFQKETEQRAFLQLGEADQGFQWHPQWMPGLRPWRKGAGLQ